MIKHADTFHRAGRQELSSSIEEAEVALFIHLALVHQHQIRLFVYFFVQIQ